MKTGLIRKKNALLALQWCINKYGESKYNNLKTLKIRINSNLRLKEKDGTSISIIGSYDPDKNEISLNLKEIRSLKYLVRSVIHEYTHFLQDITVMYHKYTDEYHVSYENHPYEKTANSREDRDWKECRLWVLRQIRSK